MYVGSLRARILLRRLDLQLSGTQLGPTNITCSGWCWLVSKLLWSLSLTY